jgi:hypothetical protein
MSTENEVNGHFPDYVNLYIYNTNSVVASAYDYTLTYSNGSFTIDTWGYGFAQPTMQDLQVLTLADVEAFAQFLLDWSSISFQAVPAIVTTARENALVTYDTIPVGSLIYNSTTGQLKCWDGTAFKTVTFDA